jgi:SAM-dependent methyltransferase
MTPAGTYVPDQDWQKEGDRLAAMELIWDPGTRAVIEALGIGPDWRCLEVGAGAGSIAAWLADKVAPNGDVLATDVNTRHLDALFAPNLEVREHDILNDPLPHARFDLVHARCVVEHLGRRALERMLPSLRPGGWLVLEGHDWAGAACYPDDEPVRHAIQAKLGLLARSGFDHHYGRKLAHELETAGLEDVGAAGRLHVYRGGSPGSAFARLTFESLAQALLEDGDLTQPDLDHALAKLDDPDTVFLSAPMIAAWGRNPSRTTRNTRRPGRVKPGSGG